MYFADVVLNSCNCKGISATLLEQKTTSFCLFLVGIYVEEFTRLHEVTKYVVPIVISLLLAVGLFGNILVVYVSVTTQRVVKHPVHSLLVLNLAVADLIYLLASAPYQVSYHLQFFLNHSLGPVSLHVTTVDTRCGVKVLSFHDEELECIGLVRLKICRTALRTNFFTLY